MGHNCSIGPLNGACNNDDHVTVRVYPCGCVEYHNPTYWVSRWWNFCSWDCQELGYPTDDRDSA